MTSTPGNDDPTPASKPALTRDERLALARAALTGATSGIVRALIDHLTGQ